MRLATMETVTSASDRIKLAVLRRIGGPAIADAAKTFLYRPGWGRPFLASLQSVIRGPSTWTVGERELFGALVSTWNRCSYCVETHGGVASRELGPDPFKLALNDWRTAPLRPQVRAMAAFLEKMTLTPDALSSADAERVRSTGVTDLAIRQAIYIGWWFNAANRTADAYGLAAPSRESLPRAIQFLSLVGYRL